MSLGRFQLRKNVIHAVVAFGLNIALVFVSYRLVILQGGVESLGLWSTLMAWIYLIRLGDVGMGSATTRFVATCDIESHSEKIRTYIDTGLVANVFLFLLLSLGGYALISAQIDFVLPSNTANEVLVEALNLLPAMFIGFFLMNISGLVLGSLQGLHLGFVTARISVAGTVLQLVAVVVLVPRIGLLGMAWALVIQHACMILFGWVLICRNFSNHSPFPRYITRSALKEMFSYSIKVQAVNLVNGVFEPLSKILVSRFGGLEAQGLYELAYKTVSLPRNAVMAGATATFPAMTGLFASERLELKKLYLKTLKLLSIAIILVLTGVIILSPMVSYFWMGNIDTRYCLYVTLLAVGYMGNTYGAAAYNLGLASGQMRNNLLSVVLSVLLMFVLGLGLSLFIGEIGVVVSAAASLLISGFFVKRMNEKLVFKGL